MEALAAISLACNIIQLVEFSSKVAVGAEDLYKVEATQENEDLTDVTETLQRYSRDITRTTAPSDAELKRLADKATIVGGDLIALLNSLSLPHGAENRRWKAVCVTIKCMQKSDEVKRLDDRLRRLQQLMNTRLLILIRESNNAISVQITELTKANGTLGADMRRNFETLYPKLEEMENRSSSTSTNVSNEPSTVVGPGPTNRQDHPLQNLSIFGSVKKYILGSTTPQNETRRNEKTQQQHPDSDDVQSMEAIRLWPDLHKLLSSLCTTASLVAKDQKILNSLYDPSLMNRYFTVDEEYKDTFHWIFDNLDHGFPQWLESDGGVYWITGKAGSGKSTLMKFILGNPRTEEILRVWAGDSDLLLINHFFWAAGAELQKSYDGLIRSLLFQILRQRPALIQKLCPRRIEGDEFTRQEPWSFPELSRTFQSLTEHGTLDACVCIFVDGLDEYDGTPADVIKILKELASYPNFKLCVSSRPWPIFKKEFSQGIEQLRMEDLTRSDIEKYVKGRLSEDHFCCRILGDNLESKSGIVWRITDSAEGVFLWVRYLVNMLLRETANEPTVSDLENLVWRYPRGLRFSLRTDA